MSENHSKSTHFLEDKMGKRWDLCLSDTFLKTAVGTGLGLLFSVIALNRRPWPVALGFGTGLGMAISNCQHTMGRDIRGEGGRTKRRGFFGGGGGTDEADYFKVPTAGKVAHDIGEGADRLKTQGGKLYDRLENELDSTTKKVEGSFRHTADKLDKGVKKVGDKLESGVKGVTDGVKKVGGKVESGVKDVSRKVEGGVKNAAEHVEAAAHKVSSSLRRDD